jgi:oligopeptide transport system substrate-binding protein
MLRTVASLLLVLQLLPGCTKKRDAGSSPSSSSGAEKVSEAAASTSNDEVTAVDFARRAVSLNFYDEPKTLDAQKASDGIGITILGHVGEGLVRLDPSNKPFPAQAESFEMTGKTEYLFKIRKGALWSDGKPVTAKDFVYGWRRTIDPKVASEYAFIMYPVKNAEEVNAGKLSVDQLGVEAVDDLTLRVTLARPTGYFIRLLTNPAYYPAREDVVTKFGDTYASAADKMLYNGPFMISDWKHNASMKLVKNEHYWNKAEIWLNEINMPYLIRDKNSEFNMFKDGKYAMTWALTKELLPDAQASRLQIRKYNYGTTWYFQMNTTRKIGANQNFRKALQYAMNREEFVKQVEGTPGSKPIFGLIPEYMPGVTKRYGDEYPLTIKDADIQTAKAYLEKAKKDLGLKEFPELAVLASDTENVRRDMEYFQRYFKEKLGLKLRLDFQTFKVRLERTDRKDFDIVNSGWGPDYLDPMTFADLFTSWNSNNSTGWSSKKYDELIKKAMDSVDAKERLDAMSAAEKILVEEAPILPYFQQARVYVQNPQLVSVLRRTVGPDPDFYYAKLSEPVAKK